MTLQQLKCICAVADYALNVSRAADALHMTQPGISKMVRSLEKELQMDIFIRRGNRLVGLSEAGNEVLALARRIMNDRKSLLALAGQTVFEKSGTLRIATSPLHARYVLSPAIMQFSKIYPAVDFELIQGRPSEIINAVASGDVNLGIGTVPGKVPSSVVILNAYPLEYCLIVCRKHPLTRLRRVHIEDIARYPLIGYDENHNSGFVVQREFQRRGLAPRIVMKTSDANVIKVYVASGLGVGIILKMAIEPERDRDLVTIPVSHIFPNSAAKISLRRGEPLKAFLYDFVHLISEEWTTETLRKAILN